jgi:hypothetical protein
MSRFWRRCAQAAMIAGIVLGFAFPASAQKLRDFPVSEKPVPGDAYPDRVTSFPGGVTSLGTAMGIGRSGAVVGPWMGGMLIAAKAPLWALFAAYCVPLLICALAAFMIGRFQKDILQDIAA